MLASLGLLSIAATLLRAGDTTPSFMVAPMVLSMLAVALLVPHRLAVQAFGALVVAVAWLSVADWSHVGLAEKAGTGAAALSGLLVSVVAAAHIEERLAAARRRRATDAS